MLARITLFFVWLAILCEGKSNCADGGNNRRRLSEVISSYNEQINEVFVGQSRAVREVRRNVESHIRLLNSEDNADRNSNTASVLHLVGPSGTGKSFLAEIVATSFFKPQKCVSLKEYLGDRYEGVFSALMAAYGIAQIGILSNPFAAVMAGIGGAAAGLMTGVGVETALKEFVCTDLDTWKLACGIVHVSFSEAQEDKEKNLLELTKTIDALAEELVHHENIILVLDDFKFCQDNCQRKLQEVLKVGTLRATDGTAVSVAKVLIILTSDLTYVTDLELRRGVLYDEALKKVEDASREYWGADSFINSLGTIIPFAPLSVEEIRKVAETMLIRFEINLKRKIANIMSELSTNSEYEHMWTGRFVCQEITKTKIIDEMHESIERRNSRAIVEELHTLLRKVINQPVPLKTLFENRTPFTGKHKIESKISSYLDKVVDAKIYDHDVYIEYVRGSRNFLKLEISE